MKEDARQEEVRAARGAARREVSPVRKGVRFVRYREDNTSSRFFTYFFGTRGNLTRFRGSGSKGPCVTRRVRKGTFRHRGASIIP